MTVNRIAEALGGEVSGGHVLAPGPGHSAQDRSLSVKLDDAAPDGFVVHSFAGDDPIACRDHVRRKIGEPAFEPKKKKANGGGKTYSPTIAKYVYRLRDDTPYLQVHRLADKSGFPQYHWDGEKWISGKPDGPKVPYMLPQLIAAAPTAPIYVVEGEKDCDNLAKIGFVATCNSEGADNGNGNKWTSDLNQYFKDRDVYIIPDNDAQGRKHAEHVARNLDPVARSVRIVELPDLPPKGDVSDWLESDTAGAKLSKIAKAAPLWEPPSEPSKEEAEATDADVEITRLAKLTALSTSSNARKRPTSSMYAPPSSTSSCKPSANGSASATTMMASCKEAQSRSKRLSRGPSPSTARRCSTRSQRRSAATSSCPTILATSVPCGSCTAI